MGLLFASISPDKHPTTLARRQGRGATKGRGRRAPHCGCGCPRPRLSANLELQAHLERHDAQCH